MSLSMNQIHGLGQADILAAILGPVVTGGASIYQTYAEGEQSEAELKQRRAEFAALSAAEREKRESAERAQIASQQLRSRQQAQMYNLSLQRSAMRGAWWQQNLPMILGGVVLVSLGVAALAVSRRRSGRGR